MHDPLPPLRSSCDFQQSNMGGRSSAPCSAAAAAAPTLSREEALLALESVHGQMGRVAVMSDLYYQRRPPYSLAFAPRDEDAHLPACLAAQDVDMRLAAPALAALRLPVDESGYRALFGAAYLGCPLGGGAIGEAAKKHADVERARERVALAAALHYE